MAGNADNSVWTNILFALPEEAASFVKRLPQGGAEQNTAWLSGRPVYTSKTACLAVYISGTGSLASQTSAHYIIDEVDQTGDDEIVDGPADKRYPEREQKSGQQRLLICGFAGGLAAGLAPGSLVIGDSARNSKGDILLADSRLLTTAESVCLPGFTTIRGTIFTANKVLGSSAEKKELARHNEAVAVDMETFAAAQVATANNIPWLALRVVTDGIEDDMPLDFNALADSDGNVDKKRVILTTLTHPWKIPGLIRLGARSSLAARNLAVFLEAYLTASGLLVFFTAFLLLRVIPCQAQQKPLSQTEAVTLAMQQSPQARVAQAVLTATLTQADRDRPHAQPTLTAVASGTAQGPRVTLPSPDYTAAVVQPEGVGRLDLILEQTLYHAGIGAARQRYAAEIALAREDYRKTLSDLAQAVRKAYLDVLRAESGVRSAQDGVDGALRYQQLVLRQIQAGVAKPSDAKTVSFQVSEATEGLRKAESGVDMARRGFNYALGRPLGTAFTLEPPDAPPTVPVNADSAIAYAAQNRPELISLELNLRLAQAGVTLARSQGQPTIAARGQFTEQTPTALTHEHYYGATLEIRWPLLDGGKMRQDTREAQAQVSRLVAERDLARLGIELDVQRAWRKMRDASDQIILTGQQRISQEKTLVVAEKAYEVGKGTAQEVQAVQRETRGVRERELQAVYDLATATIDFAHAQGLDMREIETFAAKK